MKNLRNLLVLLILVVIVVGTGQALSADKPKGSPATDPTLAGPDFAVQGEYEGQLGDKDSMKVGAQVIALGDGKFEIIFLTGGLPGAGWDGKTKAKASAKTEGGKTVISGDKCTGEIVDGKSTGKMDGLLFTLKHVVRKSPTLGAKPPEGADVLFDGTEASLGNWNPGVMVEGDLLKMGTVSKKAYKDFKLHIEFRIPYMPKFRGQGRGNSGVYLQDRYEVQVLDSFGLEAKNNECGGIYEQLAPAVSASFPPLSWQTYDIEFKAARFEDGKKTANAVVTLLQNGIKIFDKAEIKKSTPGRNQTEDAKPGPIHLQDHGGDKVYFRNIWVVPSGS